MRSYHVALAIMSRSAGAVVAVPTVTLNNGVEMPMMSLGTGMEGKIGNESSTEISVRRALGVGWTAIDTAPDYYNQGSIGRVLADVDRSSVFLTTKIGDSFFEHTGTVASAYNLSMEAAQDNLQQLNLDYVDMVIIHYPMRATGGLSNCPYMQEQWRALEDFMKLGKARAIGVSNFCQSHLACILETATVVPAINQLLLHVGMGPDPRELVSHNQALGIKTMAYSPLGSMDYSACASWDDWSCLENAPRDDSLLKGNFTGMIGDHYGKSGAQVALRWLIQHGILVATAASSEKHLRQNLEVFEFTLDDTDMQQLDVATTPPAEPNANSAGVPTCGSEASVATV